MDKCTIRGMELLELNDHGGAPSRILPSAVISIEGFDPSLQELTLKLALTKYFSSCGEVTHVYFPRDYHDFCPIPCQRGTLKSVAFMWITGEDCLDKALKLSGTDVGGWIATVKAAPPSQKRWSDTYAPNQVDRVRVTGVDTSLPKIDLQMALCNHFYSCGEVFQVLVFPGYAYVDLLGGLENAVKLSGSNMGGMNLVVEPVPRAILQRRSKEKVEMVMDAKKKNKMKKMELMKIDKGIQRHTEKKWKKKIVEAYDHGGAPSRILPSAVISVDGFDTSLQELTLKLALTKYFSSCGEVTHVYFPRDYNDFCPIPCQRGTLKSVAFMWITGEDCLDKALKLSGTDVGGWIATVKAAPPSQKRWSDPYAPNQVDRVRVTGVDTSLPKIDLQLALCNHFYSCGEVFQVLVFPGYAYVDLLGGLENAVKLSGSNMGGMNLVVEPVPSRPIINRRRKGPKPNNLPFATTGYMLPKWALKKEKEKMEREMEMVMDEKKKNKMKMELMNIDKEIQREKKSKKKIVEIFEKYCLCFC